MQFAAADSTEPSIHARVGAFGSDGAAGKRRCGGDDRGCAGDACCDRCAQCARFGRRTDRPRRARQSDLRSARRVR